MSDERWKGSFDRWKTTEPEEPISEDEDCTCTTRRRDKWCPVHGLDPDEEMEKRRERQIDKEW